MKKKSEERYNVRYYNLNEMTPEEIVEDYFASEEEAQTQALLDEGYVEVGTYTPGNKEEEEAVMNKFFEIWDRNAGVIDIENLTLFPIWYEGPEEFTKVFKREVKKAGDFEAYFGIPASRKHYAEIELNRPMYYCIKLDNQYVGYIGFNAGEGEGTLEPEIYIFQDYRRQGYGTLVLRAMVEKAFHDGLPSEKWEECIDNPKIFPSKLVASVRVENTPSQKLMEKCGFRENKDAVKAVRFITDNTSDKIIAGVEVLEYTIAKEAAVG